MKLTGPYVPSPLTVTVCGLVPVPVASVVQSALYSVKVIVPPAGPPAVVGLIEPSVPIPPLPGLVGGVGQRGRVGDRVAEVDRARPGLGVERRLPRGDHEALGRASCRSIGGTPAHRQSPPENSARQQ